MKKKRLILHIGAHKTGTTALQVFFSKYASQLSQAGVDYPYIESARRVQSGRCAGNLIGLLDSMGKLKNGRICFDATFDQTIDHLIETARASEHPTVLFSGETFSKYPNEMVASLANRSSDLEVTVLLFVRDPFDFTVSMWKQQVKRFADTRALSQYTAETSLLRTLEMFTGFEHFSKYFNDLRLINYDYCKHDIFSTFMQAAGIDSSQIPALQVGQKRFANASLTHSQACLVTHINQAYGQCEFSQKLIDYLIRHSPRRNDDFYSATVHQHLLQAYRNEINAINAHLLAEQQLNVQPREMQTHETGIAPEDRITLEDFILRVRSLKPSISQLQRIRNCLLRLRLKALPINFDPIGYRLLNPDIPADVDLAGHYCSIGINEDRPYRVRLPNLLQHPTP